MLSLHCFQAEPSRGFIRRSSMDMRFWLALIVLANIGLLFGNVPSVNLIFDVTAVSAGQWWRLFSWPFVHVSRYHLLLDAFAFLFLYCSLDEGDTWRRILLVLGSAAGSLLFPLIVSTQVYTHGLCGLSGVAHGLAVVCGLEMLRRPRQKNAGTLLLAGLLTKVAYEFWSGSILFGSLHFGSIGMPIVATHVGGAIGGFFAYLLLAKIQQRSVSE